jgi:hypothetical protein
MANKILVLILVSVVFAQTAFSIPAFARKYDMSCNVCHSPMPTLKPFGDEFANNGFRLPGQEPPRFTRETGDDELLLMRELPLALRLDGYSRYLSGNSPETDIEWSYILKILSGGQIANDVSYFMYFLFNERGDIAGVEDAFLTFHDIGGSGISATVGQYQVSDPIFKRELRPTFEDYVIYTIKPGHSRASLAYDRGLTLNYSPAASTALFASVVNGNGIGGADEGRNFDSDPYKNFFFRAIQDVDSTISIGAIGYVGTEREGGEINRIAMAGVDALVDLEHLELSAQYLQRRDRNPFFLTDGASTIMSSGGFAQVKFSPRLDRSTWYAFLLYNNVRSDDDALRYHSVTGNFTYLVARNLRLAGEYMYDLELKRHRITVGFVTAF